MTTGAVSMVPESLIRASCSPVADRAALMRSVYFLLSRNLSGSSLTTGVGRTLQLPSSKICLKRALGPMRLEEHTSELQSLMRISYAVFCLKKKKKYKYIKRRLQPVYRNSNTKHKT